MPSYARIFGFSKEHMLDMLAVGLRLNALRMLVAKKEGERLNRLCGLETLLRGQHDGCSDDEGQDPQTHCFTSDTPRHIGT